MAERDEAGALRCLTDKGGDGAAVGDQAAIPAARKGSAESLVQKRPAAPGPCVRAENEDDDGYDPYSDRRPRAEPLFERDPWA